MSTHGVFKRAMADRKIADPIDGCWFTAGKREARRHARRTLKRTLRDATKVRR